ncbi:MAG: class I SAM-dependent methyltransferase [Actinomycetota bacterium]
MAERGGAAEQVQELFDGKAATWSDKYAADGALAGRRAQLRTALRQYVQAPADVLDFGCASGGLTRAMAATGLRVTACDISAQMLRQAAAQSPPGEVDWVRLGPDWQVLPFAAGSFDAVVAFSVLEYVADPGMVLAECARVLRPGGVLLCTVPDLTSPVRWLEWLAATAGRWRVAGRSPVAGAAARRWPRLGSYLTYLQVSRQRRTVRRWRTLATQAGLGPAAVAPAPARRSTLRLHVFERPTDFQRPTGTERS